MSNKFLYFPFFGLLVPFLLYSWASELKNLATIIIEPVGDVTGSKSQTQEIVDIHNKKPATLVFTGDVLLARNVEFLMLQHGPEYPFKNLQSLFRDKSIVVGNFESAILKKHIATPSFVTTFSVDKQFLPMLRGAGFTHVSLANNHSLDYGQVTFTNTKDVLIEAGLNPFGHPQSVSSTSQVQVKSGDYTVGMLAINEVFSSSAWPDIAQELNDLKQTTDYQIVYIHWGDEYILKHNQEQEIVAMKLIDGGADAVIGHHPHVVQDIQIYNNKPIFYSLGNFIFDQYFSVDVQQGLVLEFTLTSSTVEFLLVPVSSEGTPSQPHKMPQDASMIFLQNLARRSDSAYAENIVSGKLILPINLATYP